jgi:hypothetical protein
MPTTPSQTPSLNQLQRAVEIAQQIEKLQTELSSLLGSQPSTRSDSAATQNRGERSSGATAGGSGGASGGGRKRRRMSPEARAKISAAASARWAKIRGTAGADSNGARGGSATKQKGATAATGKNSRGKKRTLSAETRAKIAEASKRRWAEKRKATGG